MLRYMSSHSIFTWNLTKSNSYSINVMQRPWKCVINNLVGLFKTRDRGLGFKCLFWYILHYRPCNCDLWTPITQWVLVQWCWYLHCNKFVYSPRVTCRQILKICLAYHLLDQNCAHRCSLTCDYMSSMALT